VVARQTQPPGPRGKRDRWPRRAASGGMNGRMSAGVRKAHEGIADRARCCSASPSPAPRWSPGQDSVTL
jgi:hypothetical protein